MTPTTRVKVQIDQDLTLHAHFRDASGNSVEVVNTKPVWEVDPAYFTASPSEDGMSCVCTPVGALGFSAIVAKYNGLSTSHIAEIVAGQAVEMEVDATIEETNRDEEAIAANIARTAAEEPIEDGKQPEPADLNTTATATPDIDTAAGEETASTTAAEAEPAASEAAATGDTSDTATAADSPAVAELPTAPEASGDGSVAEIPTASSGTIAELSTATTAPTADISTAANVGADSDAWNPTASSEDTSLTSDATATSAPATATSAPAVEPSMSGIAD